MMKIFGIVVALVFALSPLQSAEWKKHDIVPANPLNGNINTACAHDWNGDGHMDVITSFKGTVSIFVGPDWKQEVVLHRYGPQDSMRRIGGGCIHSTIYDVDGDGDMDFCGSNNTVFWLECPDDDPLGGAWTFRTIDDEILGTHCLITGDVDGDGKLDLIANSGRSEGATPFYDSLTWQKLPKNWKTAKSWERHVFADRDAPGGSHYTGFGDVNGDGKPDISCAAKGGEKFPGGEWFAWWEQPADGSVPWKKLLLAENQIGATNIVPHDLNGDGAVDFAATRGHGVGVLWFKAPGFEQIEIDEEIVGPHSLAIEDIDQDGDPDIAVCGHTEDGVAAWYANDGKGEFTKTITATNQGSYDTRLVDMDGDGDLDFLIAGHFSKNLVWLENPLK